MGKEFRMSQQNYWKIENGLIPLTIDNFLKICDILQIKPASFFSESSEDINNMKLLYLTDEELATLSFTLNLLTQKINTLK